MRFNTKIISLLYEKCRYRSCLCGESVEREDGYTKVSLLFILKVKKGGVRQITIFPL